MKPFSNSVFPFSIAKPQSALTCRPVNKMFLTASLILLCALAPVKDWAQSTCEEFEFFIKKTIPVSPWAYNATPGGVGEAGTPGAFEMYYEVYLRTPTTGSSGSPADLPDDYSFNLLAFLGKVEMSNPDLTNRVNVCRTWEVSNQIYNPSNSSGGIPNPYAQYLYPTAAGEVSWVVGSSYDGCPSAFQPVNLPLKSVQVASSVGNSKRLLFVIVVDAMYGDHVDFKVKETNKKVCSCPEQDQDVSVYVAHGTLSGDMPTPSDCGSSTPTFDFQSIYFDAGQGFYCVPVRFTGLTQGTPVNKMDGVIHVSPQMSGFTQLDISLVQLSTDAPPLEFRKKKNSDGSFELYYSWQCKASAWTPSSTDPFVFSVEIGGQYNLSQMSCFQLDFTKGRYSAGTNNAATCKMASASSYQCTPNPCSTGVTLSSNITFDPSTPCGTLIDYTLTHNVAPLVLTYMRIDIHYTGLSSTTGPTIVSSNLPCSSSTCWTGPSFDPDYKVWTISYQYAPSNSSFELTSGATFRVYFPDVTGCFHQYVTRAEAKKKSAASNCTIAVGMTTPDVCDPRIVVKLYSPINGNGVYYCKTTLENTLLGYSIENDEECNLQYYCPDVTQAPYQLTASTETSNWLCGVSTFDLVAMSKHILNVAPFTMPWQFVAADINYNRKVTTFDIVELRKAILGIYTTFPANEPWRYVNDSYVFPSPDPLDPDDYQKQNSISDVYPGDTPIFKAIKIGDITGDCPDCGAAPQTRPTENEDRTSSADGIPVQRLLVRPERVQIDQKNIVSIPVFADGDQNWLGAQAGFRFDPSQFRFVDVVGNAEQGISFGNFGPLKAASGELRFAWSFSDPDQLLAPGAWLFTIRLEKRKSGALELGSRCLSLDESILKPEAYADAFEEAAATLALVWDRADDKLPAQAGLMVRCAPNPFKQAASTIFVTALVPGAASIRLSDVNGKVFSTQLADLNIGDNRIQLCKEAAALPPGTYLITVEQNGQLAHQQIVKF